MASLSPESNKMLLTKTNLKVDLDSVNEDLNCTACGRLMVDAHETICDCRYCRECLVGLLEDSNKYCRGGKMDCLKGELVIGENVLPSPVLNMKILKARVHCPNKGCEETHVLTDLGDHLRVCSKQKVECPYSAVGCGDEGGFFDEVRAHLLRELLSHSMMLVGIIDNLRNEIGALRGELQISNLEAAAWKEEACAIKAQQDQMMVFVEDRISQLQHNILETEIKALKSQIEEEMSCSKSTRIEVETLRKDVAEKGLETRTMKTEIETLKKQNIEGKAESKKTKDDFEIFRKSVATIGDRLSMLESQKRLNQIDMEIKEVKNAHEADRKELSEIESKIMTMGEDLENIKAINIVMQTDVAEHFKRGLDQAPERSSGTPWTIRESIAVGKLRFKVPGVTMRTEMDEYIVDNLHLYSHANGYKLKLRLSMIERFRRCLNVSSIICKGEYDSTLPWPPKGLSVSVSVVNQSTNKKHNTVEIKYDDCYDCRCINRPMCLDNLPYGSSELINFNCSTTSDLIVDDSLLLHVSSKYDTGHRRGQGTFLPKGPSYLSLSKYTNGPT